MWSPAWALDLGLCDFVPAFPLRMTLSLSVEASLQSMLPHSEAGGAQGTGSHCKISSSEEQKFHPSILVTALKSGHGSHMGQLPIFQEEEEGTFARVK